MEWGGDAQRLGARLHATGRGDWSPLRPAAAERVSMRRPAELAPQLRGRKLCTSASTLRPLLLLLMFVEGLDSASADFKPSLWGRVLPPAVSEAQLRYCTARVEPTCCRGRNDTCAVPIRGTMCYCDEWCSQQRLSDCCPDQRDSCGDAAEINKCRRDREIFEEGTKARFNCNTCVCTRKSENGWTMLDWNCSNEACLVEEWLVDSVNAARLGWTAEGYREFRGWSLEHGIRYLLGTRRPAPSIVAMSPISTADGDLPESFDARTAWPEGFIRPARDQGRCGSDWAVAAADVLGDRLSILSNGAVIADLSVQQLMSCVRHEHGCTDSNGPLEEAFSYMSDQGLVSESCYPYESGRVASRLICRLHRSPVTGMVICPVEGEAVTVYKGTPFYRIANDERRIMSEIKHRGPVLAVMEVRPDFYLYRSGVYWSTGIAERERAHEHSSWGHHSVRIIGWGVERSTKYWLVTNSWGSRWGLNGTFKILRGVNESGIESFVVGVWGRAQSR